MRTRVVTRSGSSRGKNDVGLIPVDGEAGCGVGEADPALCLSPEPLERGLVVLEVRREGLVAALVVVLEPGLLLLGQHGLLDHARLDRHAGEALETEPDVPVELASRLQGWLARWPSSRQNIDVR